MADSASLGHAALEFTELTQLDRVTSAQGLMVPAEVRELGWGT